MISDLILAEGYSPSFLGLLIFLWSWYSISNRCFLCSLFFLWLIMGFNFKDDPSIHVTRKRFQELQYQRWREDLFTKVMFNQRKWIQTATDTSISKGLGSLTPMVSIRLRFFRNWNTLSLFITKFKIWNYLFMSSDILHFDSRWSKLKLCKVETSFNVSF